MSISTLKQNLTSWEQKEMKGKGNSGHGNGGSKRMWGYGYMGNGNISCWKGNLKNCKLHIVDILY